MCALCQIELTLFIILYGDLYTKLLMSFSRDAQKEDYSTRGWPIHQSGDRCKRLAHSTSTFCFYNDTGAIPADYAPYNVSKIGVNRLAEIQANTLGSDPSRPGVLVNAVRLSYPCEV